MPTLLSDVSFSARQLLKHPGFTILAVLALALGTGGATAMFSIVDTVLLRPLPFPGSGRLVSLCETHPSIDQFCVVSPPNALDWAARSRAIVAIGQGRTSSFTTRVGDVSDTARGGLATPSLFTTLGIQPAAGRLFSANEVGEQARVAIVSHAYWVSKLAGDPGVVGRQIAIDGTSHEIIGVLAQTTHVPTLEIVEIWTPLPFDPRDEERRRWRGFVTIGRLADDASAERAAAELTTLQQVLAREHPQTNAGWGARVVPLLETVTGGVRPILLALLGAVALLLVIASANVASLLVARGVARERELAVRMAIGASRGSLVRLLAIESALLAGAGAAVGLLVASWTADALLALMPGGLPRIDRVIVDGRVLAAAVAITILSAIAAGAAPALRAARVDIVDSLKEGLQPSAWRSAAGMRRALLIVEVAFAVVLAVGAGLLARSFAKYLDWQPGFEPKGLVTLWTFASQGTYKTNASVAALFERVEQELASVPGVTSAGMAANGPLFGGTESAEFTLPGLRAAEPVTANWFDMSPGYFPTLGLPIVRGRGFAAGDRAGAPHVAIVNETFVRRYLRDREPIGQYVLQRGERDMEIVGVVADVPPFTPGAATRPEIYWPYQQSPRWASFFVLRTSVPPEALRKTIASRLHGIDPDLAVANYSTMEERIARQLARPRFQLSLVGAFAVMALTLTFVGLYGVMAMLVAGRARELGVRVALGASRRTLIAMVLRQALLLSAAGLAAGLALAAGASRFFASVLHGVAPIDPLTYIGVAALVVVAAVVATLVPARRAAAADPLSNLRAQ